MTAFNFMDLKQELLKYYNISENDFNQLTRKVSYEDVPSPFLLNGMNEAIKIIKHSIDDNQKIMVYGDYDVDGIMATSITYKTLKRLKNDAGYYIPSRYLDGYGLTFEKIDEIIGKGYKLLITVDNGITLIEQIKYAKEKGLKVIVLDHHDYSSQLPSCDAIIHQNLSDLPNIKTSAGFLSYLLSKALLEKDDDYLLCLASISIVSDMMPLIGYNRDVLKLAISRYPYARKLPIDLLREDQPFDENVVSMKIGPKINAIGRIIKNTNINRLVNFFTSESSTLVTQIFYWMNEVHENRKKKSDEAYNLILDDFSSSNSAVVETNCDVGLVGLLANKILGNINKPTAVFTPDFIDSSILRGSVRIKGGFSLIDFFASIPDILVDGGGHAFAAGISIKKDDFSIFKEKFEEYSLNHPYVDEKPISIKISLSDFNFENGKLIESLSPFGEGWKAPIFTIDHMLKSATKFSKNKLHIYTRISENKKIIGFNYPEKDFQDIYTFSIDGTISFSYFNGKKDLQFLITSINK